MCGPGIFFSQIGQQTFFILRPCPSYFAGASDFAGDLVPPVAGVGVLDGLVVVDVSAGFDAAESAFSEDL